jgi:phosphotransferase system  glucose/maltose/N-acetylglucosamine-specific IIC component
MLERTESLFNFLISEKDKMQNIFTAAILVFSLMITSTFAGECANGTCLAPVLRPVRKVVNVTRDVIVAPFRAVAVQGLYGPATMGGGMGGGVAIVTAPKSCCCETAVTDSCCSSTTVTKYQPVRRRLVNRTTNVSTCQ